MIHVRFENCIFVTERQPFILAKPGDIWIDIRLSTLVRTYVLPRRESGRVFRKGG